MEEGIGKATIAAKVRNALAFYRPLEGIPGIKIRCHGTTLYNSIYRFDAEVRVHRAAPLFKLYLINNEEAFFGFYSVREHIISLGGEPRAIYDVMGKDAILFHHSTTDDDTSTGSQYVERARTWFDSVWTTIATEFTR